MNKKSKKTISIFLSTFLLSNTLGPATYPVLAVTPIMESYATPTVIASLESGIYNGDQLLTLSLPPGSNPEYFIKYALVSSPGSLQEPDTRYAGQLTLTKDTYIKVGVYKPHPEFPDKQDNLVSSAVMTKSYTILPRWEVSLASGSYNTPKTVTIEDNVSGYDVYYTLNGSDPNPSSIYPAGSTYKYTAPINLIDDGTYTIRYAAFLDSEQKGAIVQANCKIDTNAPTITLSEIDDNDTQIIGKTEPGATITVNGAGQVEPVIADANGDFTINITKQVAGTLLTFAARDDAGNDSSIISTYVLDETPPTFTVNDIDDNDTQITGTTEPGATMTVFSNAMGGNIVADANGNFTFDILTPIKAGTSLFFTATDTAGNTSPLLSKYVLDKTPPTFTVNDIDDNDTQITGTTEPGATITVNGAGQLEPVVADANGDFTVNITLQKAGKLLSFTASDTAGNTSSILEKTIIDKTAPTITINDIGDSDTQITGKTEPGATITVNGPGQNESVTADANGDFSITITPQAAGTEFSFTTTDALGNQSAPLVVTVKDTTAPAAPIINTIFDGAITVTGTSEPNAKIKVMLGENSYSGDADGNGAYVVNVPELDVYAAVLVTATDVAGNESPVASATVQPVKVTGISLDKTSLVIDATVNRNEVLTASINPSNATNQNIIWSTSDSSIATVVNGVITGVSAGNVTITAKTEEGNYSASCQVRVKDYVNIITNHSIPQGYYNLISTLQISYNLSKKAYVTIEIYQDTNLVKTVINNSLRTNITTANVTTWDGKNDQGVKVLPGNYSYKIKAVDEFGNPAVEKTGTFIASKAPVISNNLWNDTNKQIEYTLDIPSKVTIGIYDSRSQLVRELIKDTEQGLGQKSVAWDTTNVGDGVYTYRINAVDSQTGSFNATQKSGTILIDTKPVSIGITPITLYDLKGSMSIGYTLSEDANVTIDIYQKGQAVPIKTIPKAKKYVGSNTATWDGKVDGQPVAAGEYSFKITAEEVGPAIPDTTYSEAVNFTVAKTPVITVSTSDLNISSNDDTASVNYQLDLAQGSVADVTFGIYTKQGALVKEVTYPNLATTTSLIAEWDGKNNSSPALPVGDGSYTYKLSAKEKTANLVSLLKSGTITVEKGAPTITVAPELIDANNPYLYDLSKGSMYIGYTLSEDANVTIIIKDNAGNEFRKIGPTKKYVGANTTTWDGKDNTLLVQAPAGAYTYTIIADDGFNAPTSVSGSFKVNKTPIVTVTGAISEINNNNESATINYNLDLAQGSYADVTLGIYTKLGDLVKEIIYKDQSAGIGKAAIWDGTNNSATPVPVGDGVYTYKLSAVETSSSHLTSLLRSGTIIVEKGAPILGDITESQDPYNTTNGSLSIGYTINEDAKVTIKVYNSDNVLVRTLLNGISKYAGVNYVYWNGKNDDSVLLPAGTYTYKIEAVDNANNYETKSDTVVVSGTSISNVSVSANPFMADGTDKTAINFTLNRKSKVIVKITDRSGNLVKTLQSETELDGGSYTYDWNGSAGEVDITLFPWPIVDPGLYTYTISAVDLLVPSFSKTYTGTINVVLPPIN